MRINFKLLISASAAMAAIICTLWLMQQETTAIKENWTPRAAETLTTVSGRVSYANKSQVRLQQKTQVVQTSLQFGIQWSFLDSNWTKAIVLGNDVEAKISFDSRPVQKLVGQLQKTLREGLVVKFGPTGMITDVLTPTRISDDVLRGSLSDVLLMTLGAGPLRNGTWAQSQLTLVGRQSSKVFTDDDQWLLSGARDGITAPATSGKGSGVKVDWLQEGVAESFSTFPFLLPSRIEQELRYYTNNKTEIGESQSTLRASSWGKFTIDVEDFLAKIDSYSYSLLKRQIPVVQKKLDTEADIVSKIQAIGRGFSDNESRGQLYRAARMLLADPLKVHHFKEYFYSLGATGSSAEEFDFWLRALASVGNPEAQSVIVDTAIAYMNEPKVAEKIISTLSMSATPSRQTEAFLWETSDNVFHEMSLRNTATLGVGIVASKLQGERSGQVVDTLISRLQSAENESELELYLSALGNSRNAKALDAITPYLESDSAKVRQKAIMGLRLLPGEDAESLLIKIIKNQDLNLGDRLSATRALGFREKSDYVKAELRRSLGLVREDRLKQAIQGIL